MGNAAAKTDNHNLPAKLALRRRLLAGAEAFLGGPLHVLDCFGGTEAIWTVLKAEFPVAEYLSLDIKARRGRLKVDSARFVAERQERFNVVDLDAYGMPWEHFASVLRWGRPLIVFLTVGLKFNTALSDQALQLAGLPTDIPPVMRMKPLHDYVTEACLAAPFDHGFEVAEAFEALNPGGSARYYGLAIRPAAAENGTADRR